MAIPLKLASLFVSTGSISVKAGYLFLFQHCHRIARSIPRPALVRVIAFAWKRRTRVVHPRYPLMFLRTGPSPSSLTKCHWTTCETILMQNNVRNTSRRLLNTYRFIDSSLCRRKENTRTRVTDRQRCQTAFAREEHPPCCDQAVSPTSCRVKTARVPSENPPG